MTDEGNNLAFSNISVRRWTVRHISGITIYRIIEPTAVPGPGTYNNPHLYSLVCNGSYMPPNMLMAIVIAALLYVPMKGYYAGSDIPR